MKLYFATGNLHKLEEARAVLGKYGVEVEQLKAEYPEDKEKSINEIAKEAAQALAEKYKKPVMVDDTGIFFSAYDNFPGANPKWVFNTLGYEGILRLLVGKKRDAHFLCCVGFCLPGKKAAVFEGRLDGRITIIPYNLDKEVMPYERIFVPKGSVRTLSTFTREEKNKISHRAQAFEKLALYLLKHLRRL